jgi:hypothetical protein
MLSMAPTLAWSEIVVKPGADHEPRFARGRLRRTSGIRRPTADPLRVLHVTARDARRRFEPIELAGAGLVIGALAANNVYLRHKAGRK